MTTFPHSIDIRNLKKDNASWSYTLVLIQLQIHKKVLDIIEMHARCETGNETILKIRTFWK